MGALIAIALSAACVEAVVIYAKWEHKVARVEALERRPWDR